MTVAFFAWERSPQRPGDRALAVANFSHYKFIVRFDLYTDAALARDIPEHRLRRGDVVKIVDHHPSPNGESGYSIEVFNALGDTIALTAVAESALEPLNKNEVLRVRPLTAAR